MCCGVEVAAEQYRCGAGALGKLLREVCVFLREEGLAVEVPPGHVGGSAPEGARLSFDERCLCCAALHLVVAVAGGHIDGLDTANRQAREDSYAFVVTVPTDVGFGEGPLVSGTHFVERLHEQQGVVVFADRNAGAAAVVEGLLHHGGGGELVDFLQRNDVHLLFNNELGEGTDLGNLVDFAPAVRIEGEEAHVLSPGYV